jgi:hypothetical protein
VGLLPRFLARNSGSRNAWLPLWSGVFPGGADGDANRDGSELAGFVSRVAPLAEGPEWFTRLHDREPGLVKVVLEP